MSRRTWIKIFAHNWLRGTLREETAELRGIWIDVLALAGDSAYGEDGIIKLADEVGYTDEQIAAVLKLGLKIWLEAKTTLIKTERISIIKDNIIKIENWNKYQSEYKRQAKYRKVTKKGYKKKLQSKDTILHSPSISISTSLSNKEFIDALKASPAYKNINLETEFAKMDTWILAHKGRKKTRRFMVNWLNKVEAPMEVHKKGRPDE